MGTYIDDERQSPRPPGPRPAGLAAKAPSAASQQLKGSTDPVFAAASCIWGLCGQSILIFRRDRALGCFDSQSRTVPLPLLRALRHASTRCMVKKWQI